MQPGVTALRSLRERPFELLREIDRRARATAQGKPESIAAGAEWVGVAFRLGGEAFLLAREETREVLAYPASVTRVPGAKPWIRGLSNVRGQLLPVIDLRAFLGAGATSVTRSSRSFWRRSNSISVSSSRARASVSACSIPSAIAASRARSLSVISSIESPQ